MDSDNLSLPEEEQPDHDSDLVRRYLAGDTSALNCLYEKHRPLLLNILACRGAKPKHAEEAVSRVWARCVSNDQTGSLLEKYNGECALKSWLAAVTTNQWYDIVRKESREVEYAQSPDSDHSPFDDIPAPCGPTAESDLTRLLHDCIEEAFAQAEPAALIMLHLVYLHELTQREVGRLWGWHEAKVSRRLSSTMEDIQRTTLQLLRRKDPRVRLDWEDFLEMCKTYQIGQRRVSP